MAKPGTGQDDGREAGRLDAADPFGMRAWLEACGYASANPLLVQSTAMTAAVASVGFGVASAFLQSLTPAAAGVEPAEAMNTGKPAASPATDPVATVPKAVRAKASPGSDLKRIDGIGPKVEQVLKARGVETIDAIAGWNEDDVARFDRELELDGRIARDGWVAQAAKLSATRRPAGSR